MLAIGTTVVAILGFGQVASALPIRDPIPPPTDYWQKLGFINMAHQGGEQEAPGYSLFAYMSAVAAGADMITVSTG